MAIALCVISFALGLVSIDMFCDHYFFVSPSLTPTQFNTCSSYYRNAAHQPWYTSLVTLVPIILGTIVMFRNIRRTIYDTLSVPLFILVVGIFIFRIKKYLELLVMETKASNNIKEGYLREIANNHAIIAGLLVLLLILQSLAERKIKISVKKYQ